MSRLLFALVVAAGITAGVAALSSPGGSQATSRESCPTPIALLRMIIKEPRGGPDLVRWWVKECLPYFLPKTPTPKPTATAQEVTKTPVRTEPPKPTPTQPQEGTTTPVITEPARTSTPTAEATPAPTATPTRPPTFTPSPTPSPTLRLTDTPTPSPTFSPAPSPTPGPAITANISVISVGLTPPVNATRNVPFTVPGNVTLRNRGPAGPVLADVTFALTAPADCIITPAPPDIIQNRSLPALTNVFIGRTWSVTCSLAGPHAFGLGVNAVPDPVQAFWDNDTTDNTMTVSGGSTQVN